MALWELEDFEQWLDRWIDGERPEDWLRVHVTAWMLTRFDDPYQGARREPGFDNLWFVVIPGTLHRDTFVVVCSYFIFEQERRVTCKGLATLSLPV